MNEGLDPDEDRTSFAYFEDADDAEMQFFEADDVLVIDPQRGTY
jgi:hypothetical protein